MKQRTKNSSMILLAILAFMTIHGFAQDNPLFRNIPPDANAVFQVNIPVITTKLSWSEMMENIHNSKMLSSAQGAFLDMLKDPAKAGIDMGKDIFLAEEARNPLDSISATTLILHLQDSGKFIAFMQTQEPGLRTYSIPNKNKVRTAGKDKMGLAWNKELAILVFVKPPIGEDNTGQAGKTGQEGSTSPPNGKPRPATNAPGYALIAAKKGLMAINGFDNSFYATDQSFKTGFSDDADIHMWTEKGKGLSFLMNNLLKSRIPVQSLLKSGGFNPSGTDGASGAKSLTSIRFEAGKVIMKSSTILTPETAPFAAKMNSRPLNIDLVASIPKGNLLALIDFHFDPTVIADILDKAGLRAKADSFLTAQNLPLDTLTRAFKGDFQLAVMEPEMVEGAKSPKVPIYFVTSINDLSAFSKISSTIKAKKDAAASDSSAGASRNPFAKMKFASTRQGNILVLSSAKEYTDGWFSNTEKRNTAFVTDRIKDNPFSMLIDFKTLTHFIDGLMKDKTPAGKEKKMLDLIHGLDRMTIASGGLRDGKSEAYIELQLTDTSTNSLVQLYRILHQ